MATCHYENELLTLACLHLSRQPRVINNPSCGVNKMFRDKSQLKSFGREELHDEARHLKPRYLMSVLKYRNYDKKQADMLGGLILQTYDHVSE